MVENPCDLDSCLTRHFEFNDALSSGDMELKRHRTAIVTGGASGIGLGIVKSLLDVGMNVVSLDARRPALDDSVTALGDPPRLLTLEHDVRDREAWTHALEAAVSHFGNVHVLVGNAGVIVPARVTTATLDEWEFM